MTFVHTLVASALLPSPTRTIRFESTSQAMSWMGPDSAWMSSLHKCSSLSYDHTLSLPLTSPDAI